MRLTAISTGYAIPYIDFDASVHSVFRTAVNLRPANKDLLLTLVVASEADLPQGNESPGYSGQGNQQTGEPGAAPGGSRICHAIWSHLRHGRANGPVIRPCYLGRGGNSGF